MKLDFLGVLVTELPSVLLPYALMGIAGMPAVNGIIN